MNRKTVGTLCVVFFTLVGAGCGFLFAKPSGTVKKFYKNVESGELDAAIALFSKTSEVNMFGPAKVKAGLTSQSQEFKKRKGIDSISITDEQINGEIGVVRGTVKFNDGSSVGFDSTLNKEDGNWKIVKIS